MSRTIPHSRPSVGPAEADAVRRVVLSGQLAQGPEVAAFESEVAAACHRRFGVAVSSGTAGLQLALLVLGIGPADQVLVPSYACTALLHAVRAAGAQALPVDVDRHTGNLDPRAARHLLGRRVRAVILPHMFGLPVPVEEVAALGVPLVEDCAMSLGARHAGRPVGSFGPLSVCSFYATKMLATGEGGMVLMDEADLAEAVRGRREYDHLPAGTLRYNCKLTDMAAACGRVQLGRLPGFVERRRALATRYDRALEGSGLAVPPPDPEHVYYRYVVGAGPAAPAALALLESRGVAARRPVARPLHRELGLPDEAYPGTVAACLGHVSVPLYPSLTEEEAAQVTAALGELAHTGREDG
ncbi:MAG: DegT/DnrJ/EryC1/StrS aminotransferase family protein [Candidatus Latescibacterota bacterium]